MRKFRYNTPTDTGNQVVQVTEEEILSTYFDYWSSQMVKAGKQDLISPENCIDDFVVVHWAWEVWEDQ